MSPPRNESESESQLCCAIPPDPADKVNADKVSPCALVGSAQCKRVNTLLPPQWSKCTHGIAHGPSLGGQTQSRRSK